MIPAAGRRLLLQQQQRRLVVPMPLQRTFSSKYGGGEPRFKIPAHVAVFTLLMVPCVGFAAYAQRYGMEEEELEERVRDRYRQDIAAVHQKNKAMQDFYQKAIKDADGGAEDDRLAQVLHGGKGEKKRLHAIDKKLYGTEAGVEEKHRVEEEIKAATEEKRKRRKRRKEKGLEEQVVSSTETAVASAQDADITQKAPSSPGKTFHVDTTHVVTIAVVGTIAALAGFLAGGRRN